jgi:hypothetical protein
MLSSGQYYENLGSAAYAETMSIALDEVADLIAKRKLPKLRRLGVSEIDGDEAACEAFTVALCAAPKQLEWVSWGMRWDAGTTATKEQADRIKASGREYPWRAPKK